MAHLSYSKGPHLNALESCRQQGWLQASASLADSTLVRNKHSSLQPQTVWASISLPPCCDPTPVSLEMTISRVLESSRLPRSNLPHIFIIFYHHPVPDHCSLLMNPYALLNLTWRAALEGKLSSRNLWLIWLWDTRCKSKQGARKKTYVERGPGEVFFGKNMTSLLPNTGVPPTSDVSESLSVYSCIYFLLEWMSSTWEMEFSFPGYA